MRPTPYSHLLSYLGSFPHMTLYSSHSGDFELFGFFDSELPVFGKTLCPEEKPSCFSLRLDDYIYRTLLTEISFASKDEFILLFNTPEMAPSPGENLVLVQFSKRQYRSFWGK